MNDADLDDSWVVAGLTWTLYMGWLTALSGIALWIGVEPLPSVQARFPGSGGTIAALGVGVAFILASRQLYDALRRRYLASSDAGPEKAGPDGPDAAASVADPSSRGKKRKRKKKKRK